MKEYTNLVTRARELRSELAAVQQAAVDVARVQLAHAHSVDREQADAGDDPDVDDDIVERRFVRAVGDESVECRALGGARGERRLGGERAPSRAGARAQGQGSARARARTFDPRPRDAPSARRARRRDLQSSTRIR